jgi:alpha-glucuronidase
MASWPAYEKYSGNLGIQTLTDILYTHFGPNPASQDDNGWGQWTRADRDSIGMDRTVKNGTGFAGQYPPEVARTYENLETTPDELLLWFHHVPYTQRLRSSNKTVIQHFYDAHYAGAETAHGFPALWSSLQGKIDSERFEHVRRLLTFQAGHAIVWRDAVAGFYRNLSGIDDAAGRVGHHPWRVEAENMTLKGYEAVPVTPFETASNFTAVRTTSNTTAGEALATLAFPAGTYDLAIGYFDHAGGRATWEAYVGDKLLGRWVGNNEDTMGHATSTYLDGHSATRITFAGVQIAPGATLRIVGTPDGKELAPLDYVAVLPSGVVD